MMWCDKSRIFPRLGQSGRGRAPVTPHRTRHRIKDNKWVSENNIQFAKRGHKRDVCYLQKVTLVYRLLPALHFCFNAIVYRLFLGLVVPIMHQL